MQESGLWNHSDDGARNRVGRDEVKSLLLFLAFPAHSSLNFLFECRWPLMLSEQPL